MVFKEVPSALGHNLADTIRHIDGDAEYDFKNSWLVDVDSQIKQFEQNDKQYIAKKTTHAKAATERDHAQAASDFLDNVVVGERRLSPVVPEIVGLSEEDCYLVSEFSGPDINEQYYRGARNPLEDTDFERVFKLLSDGGISFRGFLPRNTIVTDEAIHLIDWERMSSVSAKTAPDEIAWTEMVIGWSYFFEREFIEDARDRLDGDAGQSPPYQRF